MDDLVQKMRFELESSYIGLRNWNGLERDIKGVVDRWNTGLRGKLNLATDAGMGVGAVGLGLAAGALKEAVGVESASGRMKAAYNVNQKDFENYSRFIENNSVKLLQSQKDLWDGMALVAAAGFSGKVATQIETGASKIATIFGVTLPDAIKPGTIAMRDFHKSAKDTYDLLGKAASMTPGGWGALFTNQSGRLFNLASGGGLSLPDTLNALVQVTRQTGGGRGVGSLATLLTDIENPSNDPKKLQGGTQLLQGQGLSGAIRVLYQRYGDQGLGKIFGSEANLAKSLLGPSPDVRKGAPGYIDTAFGKISKEVPEEWKGLKLEMEATAVSIGKVLIPDLQKFMAWVQPIAKGISDWTSHNAALAGDLIKVAIGVGGVSLAFRAAMFFINPFRDALSLFGGKARAAKEATQALSDVTNDLASAKLPAMKSAEQAAATAVQDMSQTRLPALQTATQQTATHIEDLYGNRLPVLNTGINTVGNTAVRTAETKLTVLDAGMTTMGDTAVATAGESRLAGLTGAIGKLGSAASLAIPALVGAYLVFQEMKGGNPDPNGNAPDPTNNPLGFLDWVKNKAIFGPAQLLTNLGVLPSAPAPGSKATQYGPSPYNIVGNPFGLSSTTGTHSHGVSGAAGMGVANAGGVDVDIGTGTKHEAVYLPGGKGQKYIFGGARFDKDIGWIETWTPVGGGAPFAMLHLSSPGITAAAQKGQVFTGGEQVGVSGNPLTSAYGNTPGVGNSHLCIVTTQGGWSYLASLTTPQIKATGAIPIDGSGGPVSTPSSSSSGYQSSLPPDASGVDHTGQPGWVIGADGKWHSVPKPTKSNYTWDFSTGSWVPTAAYREEQRLGGLYAGEKVRTDAIDRVWSGVNPTDLPAHGNHGLNQTEWLKDQYTRIELLREQWDQSAKILYLQGKITYQQWQQVKAKDAMYVQSHDALAYQRLHPGSGGAASHIIPVRIEDRCKEEAKANVHRKAQADHAKGTKDAVAKSGDAIVNAVKGVHHAISALEKSLHHHGIHEGSHAPFGGGGSIEPAHAY